MEGKINFLNFDIYAKRPGFFYNNEEKIGSYFGLFLTILYIIAFIVLFIYNLMTTIKRSEIKVYDSSLYAQEMPIINLDRNYFNFAFGLEDTVTLNRFVDETIYYPKVDFIDRIKINGEFQTITNENLPLEKCKQENFGENYQHLLLEGELSNSYCLKDFDYNLVFAGGFKYERMSYIRIKIFPCKNTTENNNHCKPQEILDSYMTSGYFSILLKDIGLNPSNYLEPTIPTLQDLYTTIDRRLYKNYILNFGLTEIQTDIGLFNENIKKERHIQFRKELQTFSFRDESQYLQGKDIILIQIRLDDNIFIQKRTYTKISEILSRIGGYMQLMYTAFLLLSITINKINSQLKIVNSIFNFNLKENKMELKLQSLKIIDSMVISKSNKKLIFPLKNVLKNSKEIEYENSKSNNNLILKNNFNNNVLSPIMSPYLNIHGSSKNEKNQSFIIKINKKNFMNHIEERKNKSINSKINLFKIDENNIMYNNINKQNLNKNLSNDKERKNNFKNFNENINLRIFDYFCPSSDLRKKRMMELYHFSNDFYKKRMDIVLVFSQLLLTEKVLLNNNNNKHINSSCNDIEYPIT